MKKKKSGIRQYIPMAFFVLLGAGCGFLMGYFSQKLADQTGSRAVQIVLVGSLFVMMYLSILVHLILHEAGHLLFGLLSGYRFSSFRIMNLMWVKENGHIRTKRYSLAGTGGQCLMEPPAWEDGNFPVLLYNLGGSFVNLFLAIVFFILFAVTASHVFLSAGCLIFALTGLAIALMNGLPLRLGTVDNDGYNALSAHKNQASRRGFWLQMEANARSARGQRLKEMPAEWFSPPPTDEEMTNSMTAVVGVLCCSRLMDELRLEEADTLMEHYLSIESGIVGLHREILQSERIFCALIAGNRPELVKQLYTPAHVRFVKAMKTNPSILRTEYAYACLFEKDADKAVKLLADFEKIASTYPYPCEIASERELIALCDKTAEEQSAADQNETT